MDIKNSVLMITGGAIRVGKAQALYMARKGRADIFQLYLRGAVGRNQSRIGSLWCQSDGDWSWMCVTHKKRANGLMIR